MPTTTDTQQSAESIYWCWKMIGTDFARAAADLSAAFQKVSVSTYDIAQTLEILRQKYPPQKSPRRTRLVTRIKKR